MEGDQHSSWSEFFRQCPEQAVALLSDVLGVQVSPYGTLSVEPPEIKEYKQPEGQVDAVVSLWDEDESPSMAIVVEVQRGRNAEKRYKWPHYLAHLRDRWRCDVCLLVVCPDRSMVGWCSTPIRMGQPQWDLVPLAVGPDMIPVVTDHAAALENPELAVLSAMAHGADSGTGGHVLEAMFAGFEKVETSKAATYTDLVQAALPSTAGTILEKLMQTYEYRSDFAKTHRAEGRVEGRVEGEAEGEARSILKVLDNRGVPVSDGARQRVQACTDQAVLDLWLRRSLTADTADDLFD